MRETERSPGTDAARNRARRGPLDVLLVALPETAGSALYGMLDVFTAAGRVWQSLARAGTETVLFRVRIVAPWVRPFRCGNGIPVIPDLSVGSNPHGDIVVIPELWLGPDEHLGGRHVRLLAWLRARHDTGAFIYSACSGSLLLAESGLLDGRDATSHWGYQDLFRHRYPRIRFHPEPTLCFSEPTGRIVTSGGASSWHDLALHIIGRHASPGEALRTAKVYLLKWHDEGQLPYTPLIRIQPHEDAVVRRCEAWLARHYAEPAAVAQTVRHAQIPERTLKRRFKLATGMSLIDYVQNLRIEEAKRQLESTNRAADDISAEVGYEDPSFFRRLFKRRTGLAPRQYRQMFSAAHR
ncbi:GlxA family transcriptional regulator [Cupriavidus oxalaticus]|jgi:transcriptional regulator GlxA family with amidase domain|uniref:Helix-turn-helix domain-containing protein n=1 Tax=Cupriavidus oxalaticus TaxID=96344 RepID=A0A5P3VET9_9BURK|nr:helix-turn-helix domain-containing protein [Cupriavidus oxalaticus]QEZ43893.1 helix-turn-helix domain-containing protein [Cupriavidus oxalaticus]